MNASAQTAALDHRPAHISPEEWRARVELAGCYRLFAHLGWTELIFNHITLRVPGDERHFLINPFGLHYTEVTASNLVKIDIHGNIIGHSDWPINPAGFTAHAAMHEFVDGAHCVMHTHTEGGLAVASLKSGLNMSNFYSAQLYGKVAYHDFEGVTIHVDEGPRMVKSIGDKRAVIMRNHGLMSWGETVAQAFNTLFLLTRACEIQVKTMAMGEPLLIPEDILRKSTEDSPHHKVDSNYSREAKGMNVVQSAFDAMIRIIDRIDPSYRL